MKYKKAAKEHWLLELERAYRGSVRDKKVSNWLGARLHDDYAAMLEWFISRYRGGEDLAEKIKGKVYGEAEG